MMWFKLERNLLEELIERVVPVIPSRTPYPIIQNILCSTEGGNLSFLATDLDIYVKTWTALKAKEEAKILLPGRKLLGIVKESNADEMEFTREENKIIVKAGRSVFKMPILDAEEFPRMFELPQETRFSVDGKDLRHIFEAVEFAVSKGEDRPAMTGIYWELKNQRNRMVATDGHRMAVSEDKNSIPKIEERSQILPTKIFNFFPKEIDGPIEVSMDNTKIGLSFNSTEVVSRLIEGPYPDYEKVIPKEIKNVLTVNRDELTSALRRMMIFTNQVTRQVKLVLGKKTLEISSFSPEGEEAHEELTATYKGESFEVAYNGSYLLDIMRHIETEDVVFDITGALSAALIHGSGTKDEQVRFYLLMPILLD
jgi:DNA polymerase-3 subunit beta